MANSFITPTFTKQCIPKSFFLEAQFCAYKITSQQARFTCLLNGLTPEVTELVLDVIPKPSISPQEDLKLPILENSKQLDGLYKNENEKDERIEPSYGRQRQHGLCIIVPETEFDTKQFHTHNRERSKNFRSSLVIPIQKEERRNSARMSKHLPPTRDDPGVRAGCHSLVITPADSSEEFSWEKGVRQAFKQGSLRFNIAFQLILEEVPATYKELKVGH
ncbi:hypothetical protein ACTXT7_008758 [Hymenolepis weldensis]